MSKNEVTLLNELRSRFLQEQAAMKGRRKGLSCAQLEGDTSSLQGKLARHKKLQLQYEVALDTKVETYDKFTRDNSWDLLELSNIVEFRLSRWNQNQNRNQISS